MGKCVSKHRHAQRQLGILRAPEFFYVNRSEGQILSIKLNGFTSFSGKTLPPIYPNCLIGYSSSLLYLICGTKPNKATTKKCFEINLAQNTSSRLQNIPKTLTYGEVFLTSTMLYIINTETFSIYIYYLTESCWKTLEIRHKLRELEFFSCCNLQGCLYFSTGKYKEECSHSIYMLPLKKDKQKVSELNLQFPHGLVKAKSAFLQDCKIIGGGYLENGDVNKKFYIIGIDDIAWKVIECPMVDLTDNYPVIFIKNSPAFISFPTMFVWMNDLFIVFNLNDGKGESVIFNQNKVDNTEEIVINAEKGGRISKLEKDFIGSNEEKLRILSTKTNDREQALSEEKEEKEKEKSSISSGSGSYVLKARVLTPINYSFRGTISSYDSGFSSQSLYSDESDENHLQPPEVFSNIDVFSDIPRASMIKSGFEELKLSEIQDKEPPTTRNISKIHNIEVLVNYAKAKEFIIFTLDLLQVKNKPKLPEKSPNFTLFELERILKKLKFKLYPKETFKYIVKAADLIFRAKKLTKGERKRFRRLAGLERDIEYVEQEKFVESVLFRIKVAILGDKNT